MEAIWFIGVTAWPLDHVTACVIARYIKIQLRRLQWALLLASLCCLPLRDFIASSREHTICSLVADFHSSITQLYPFSIANFCIAPSLYRRYASRRLSVVRPFVCSVHARCPFLVNGKSQKVQVFSCQVLNRLAILRSTGQRPRALGQHVVQSWYPQPVDRMLWRYTWWQNWKQYIDYRRTRKQLLKPN